MKHKGAIICLVILGLLILTTLLVAPQAGITSPFQALAFLVILGILILLFIIILIVLIIKSI